MGKIISEFVREQKRYSQSNLRQIFKLKADEITGFIKNLKAFGVLKSVKNNMEQRDLTDLLDEDIEISDTEVSEDAYLYVFTYVGVITIGRRIIKCYPKYLLSQENPINEMKQVLKVLNKHGANEQVINLYNGDENNKSFNILAVILFLINDYYENGIYSNTEDVIEVNGEGAILWDKTINESFTFISNNRPYYTELYTEKTIEDEYDFFRRLHECILTQCSKQLKVAGLLELFDIIPIEISEQEIDDFGDKEYILYRIQSELSIQFNTRKQILLKTLYAYIAQERSLEDSYGISMYGTNSFNLVWENVCAKVFSNKLNTALAHLDLGIPLLKEYNPSYKLIDVIEKPTWIGYHKDESEFKKKSKDTLVPDLISVVNDGKHTHFIIFDAKYYNLQLEKEKELRNYPGIGDITKQYLYQLAYKKFIQDHNIEIVKNCFLMPTEKDNIEKTGIVKLDMFSSLELQNIQIRLLPAKMIFDKYISDQLLNICILDL